MISREEFESKVQRVVERVYEDEMLRADLIDEEAQPLLDWASNYLFGHLENLYTQATDKSELENTPDTEYGRVKEVVLEVIRLTASEAPASALPASPEGQTKPTPEELAQSSIMEAIRAVTHSFGSVFGNKETENKEQTTPSNNLAQAPATTVGTTTKVTPSRNELEVLERFGVSPDKLQNLSQELAGKSRQEQITWLVGLLETVT